MHSSIHSEYRSFKKFRLTAIIEGKIVEELKNEEVLS
jgi:hypothetical protein